jgi:hypothetical protein
MILGSGRSTMSMASPCALPLMTILVLETLDLPSMVMRMGFSTPTKVTVQELKSQTSKSERTMRPPILFVKTMTVSPSTVSASVRWMEGMAS